MNKIIIGIDPGANGAIAHIHNGKVWSVKNTKDILKMKEYFDYLKSLGECIAYVEKVQIFISDSNSRGKQFGIQKLLDHYQQIKDSLIFAGIKTVEVYPQTWQSVLNLKSGFKNEKKTERKRRYKEYATKVFNFPAKNYDADALLIALYGVKLEQKNVC